MRYSKGAIALSPTQDLPLLRQVMYSKYVTQTNGGESAAGSSATDTDAKLDVQT